MNILTINLLSSTLVFWVAARIYVLPKLSELRPQTVLLPILLLHSFRHLGLMFLAPGATDAGIPSQFAFPAALGDLLAAVLALIALLAVARGMKRAGFSYGSLMLKERWISLQRSYWPPSTEHQHSWGRHTGSLHSGCLPCW